MAAGIRKIAITGAPSSGKTTIVDMLCRLLAGRVLVVPEVPTLFFHSGLGPASWERIVSDAGSDAAMMKGIVALRCGLEQTYLEIAALSGVKALLVDRGSPDAASYLDDPGREYSALFARDLEADVRSYHAVIQLGAIAPSPVGGRPEFPGKRTDPPGDRVAVLEERLKGIWGSHARYHFVSAEMELGRKLTAVMGIMDSLLA